MLSEIIYSRDSKGKVRTWQSEVDGARWRTISGLIDGAKVASGWTLAKAKNVGKKNESSPEFQALCEAAAELDKKLDRDYRRTIAELDSVPPSPMLAHDFAKQKKVDDLFPMFMQPKLDGIRALISRHGAFSREYQRHHNVDHILAALAPYFAANPDHILDGELYNHDLREDFNSISSVVRKQNVEDADRERARELTQFHVYDIISDDDYEGRYAWLEQQLCDMPDCIRVVLTYYVDNANDSQEHNNVHGEFIEEGYEGSIYRSIKGGYQVDKRSKLLLKRKDFLTAEFPLLGIGEGEGTWSGYAKRIETITPEGKNFSAGIRGSKPFCAELLRKWADRENHFDENACVTIRYFTPTPDGIPRFPVAIDFHPKGRKD